MGTRGPCRGCAARHGAAGQGERQGTCPARAIARAKRVPTRNPHVLGFFAIPMETIVNNCNKPYNTDQGQEWVDTRPAHPGGQRAKNRRWRDVGSGERADIPAYTSRIRLPCLWKKVDFGSKLRGRGRSRGRPRGFWGLTPADPGTCTTAAPEGRTSPCPGSGTGALSPTRVGSRRAAATRPDGAQGAAAMPRHGAGRGRGRRESGCEVRGVRGVPPRRGAPLCSRGRC